MEEFVPINDEQWRLIEPLFSDTESKRRPGQPHADWRSVVNSILYWQQYQKWDAIPRSPEYAAKSTANRWYIVWKKSYFLESLYKAVSGKF